MFTTVNIFQAIDFILFCLQDYLGIPVYIELPAGMDKTGCENEFSEVFVEAQEVLICFEERESKLESQA